MSRLDEELKYPRIYVINVVGTSSKVNRFPLLQRSFLKSTLPICFRDTVIKIAETFEKVINQRENQFFDDQADGVNDAIWMDLSYYLVKCSRDSWNLEINHKQTTNGLKTKISELTDIQTGSGYSGYTIAGTMAGAKSVEVFVMVSRNTPNELEALLSALW